MTEFAQLLKSVGEIWPNATVAEPTQHLHIHIDCHDQSEVSPPPRQRDKMSQKTPVVYVDVGQRIRQRREQMGLTQAALAERLGVDRSTLARWEQGGRLPNTTHRRLLAQSLGGRAGDYDT